MDAAADCGAGEGRHRRCRHRRARRGPSPRPAVRRRAYEAEPRAGGHAHTVLADGHALDSGFVVCNERNYPEFLDLMRELGIALRPSTMSFSVRCERCDLEFSGHGLRGLFAQRRNLVRPSFARMLLDLGRFFRNARAVLDDPAADRLTIGEFLDARRLRARADRSLPRADGRGDLVVVAGAHARDARALLRPLLRQPRPARRARRPAVAHDRGRLAGLRAMRSARACAAACALAAPVRSVRRDDARRRGRAPATARPSASTA